MTLRQFLDAGYALLVEEYQRLGTPLMEALEKLQDMSAHTKKPGEVVAESAVISQNEASLRQLQQMMGGVG